MLLPYEHMLTAEEFGTNEEKEYTDIKSALFSQPILQWIYINKRPYLQAGISKIAMATCLLQPGDNHESIAVMKQEE
eukprot:13544556-Ditylum_brightwellii.AAC.2